MKYCDPSAEIASITAPKQCYSGVSLRGPRKGSASGAFEKISTKSVDHKRTKALQTQTGLTDIENSSLRLTRFVHGAPMIMLESARHIQSNS